MIPLNGPVIGGGWWIELGYAEPHDFDADGDRWGQQRGRMTFPAGCTPCTSRPTASYDSVIVDNSSAGATACVTQLVLGAPATGSMVRDPAPCNPAPRPSER